MKEFFYTSKAKSYVLGAIGWAFSIFIAFMLSKVIESSYLYWTLDAMIILICAGTVSRAGARAGFARKRGVYSINGDTVLIKMDNKEVVIKGIEEISYFEDTFPHILLGTCWDLLSIKSESVSITIQADRSENEKEKEDRTLYLVFEDIRRCNSRLKPMIDSKGELLEDRWKIN